MGQNRASARKGRLECPKGALFITSPRMARTATGTGRSPATDGSLAAVSLPLRRSPAQPLWRRPCPTSRITPFKLTRNLAPTPPPSRCAVTEEAHRRQAQQLAGRRHARPRRPSRDRGGARAEISRGRGREGVRPERRSVQAPVDVGARLT